MNSAEEHNGGAGPLPRELAHALTNQFGVIRNFAELAAEDLDDPRSLRQDLAEIQEAAERGLELAGQVHALGERDATDEAGPSEEDRGGH